MHTIATEKQILKKFADDTKIAQFIESPEELQETLNRLSAFFFILLNGLEFLITAAERAVPASHASLWGSVRLLSLLVAGVRETVCCGFG